MHFWVELSIRTLVASIRWSELLKNIRQVTASLLLAGSAIVALPAHASLIADGITYTLSDNGSAGASGEQFTLGITGINGPSDTEGGRYGVQSFAFNLPTNYLDATAPSGFGTRSGGLAASGCNGNGNFFCFSGAPPAGPAMASNSSLSFVFDVNATGGVSGWQPDFKINWTGTKNNYDLVSLPLSPGASTPSVPEPSTLALMALGLVGFGFARRARKL